ncbi:MAG: hypothetical protein U1F77_02335 [Kiritimatiellia bacterium]
MLLPVALAVSGAMAIAGCAGLTVTGRGAEDLESPRHPNFWNFYRRAIVRMGDKRWQEASEDLERCLGTRGGAKFGYPFDKWRVRTYGLHVTEHYFPHRELGVCLLELGEPAKAEESLLESLRLEPSARARYYLNLARERMVRDQTLPAPEIETEGGGTIYSRVPEVEVRGRASGRAYVAAITVAGREQFVELAENDLVFRQKLVLAPGEHAVEVEARDLKKQPGRKRLRVIVDPVSPQFQFSGAVRKGNAWELTGVCADAHGLRAVAVDGKSVLPAPGEAVRQTPVKVALADGAAVTLAATDWAGNELKADVRKDILPRLLAAGRAGHQPGLLGENHEFVSVTEPLSLDIDRPGTLNLTYEDHFFLSGVIHGEAGLASLMVQGTNVLESAVADNQLTRFGCFVPVAMGTSTVQVVAGDKAGERVETTVRIERREPAFAKPELRLSSTLPPLVNAELLSDWFPAQERLLEALVDRPLPFEPRFQVLARGDDLLGVLRELRLNLSDLVDDRARVPLRKIATSDLFFNGEVLPDPGGFTVRLHTVSTEDGRWLGSDDVYLARGTADPVTQMRGLAAKVERRFPVVSGPVGRGGRRSFLIAAGAESGLIAGARLLLIRPGEDGTPRSGRLVQAGAAPVELLVTAVKDREATVRIATENADTPPETGDWFYSR